MLAHELGHFRLRHVRKRLLLSMLTTFVGLALLGWLAARPDFYARSACRCPRRTPRCCCLCWWCRRSPSSSRPLASLWSRRHEFEADAFATRYASAAELATALVKLHRDNASTLTPDPVYAAFYYSHPPPLARITRLRAAAAAAGLKLGASLQGM